MAVLHEVSSFFIAATARRTAGRCEIGFVLAFTFSFESNATISHFSVKIKIFFRDFAHPFFQPFSFFPASSEIVLRLLPLYTRIKRVLFLSISATFSAEFEKKFLFFEKSTCNFGKVVV